MARPGSTLPILHDPSIEIFSNALSSRNDVTTLHNTPNAPKRFSLFVPFAASVAALGGLLFGYDIGVISGALLQLKTDFFLTCLNQEMVVSFMLVGALVASLLGGSIIDWIGSRWTIIINALIFVGGAVILTLANSYAVLLCGRFVIGFAVALSAVSECIYIAEIALPHNRGMLVTLNELGIAVGFLLAFTANYLFSETHDGWRYMFGLSAIPAVIQIAAMAYLPHTPHYLLLRGRDEEAEAVVKKLRGQDENEGKLREELMNVRFLLDISRQASFWALCSSRDNIRRCLALGAGLVVAQQLTGAPNILYYAPEVFKELGFCNDKAALLANLGLGVVKLGATVVSLFVVDRLGRRLTLLWGCAVMFLSIIALAAFAIFHARLNTGFRTTPCVDIATGNVTVAPLAVNYTLETECFQGEAVDVWWRYMALVAIMVYVAAYAFSFAPVTWLLLSEIFPPNIKGRAMAVTTGLNWGTNWVVSSTYLRFIAYVVLLDLVTLGGTFIFYGVMCFLAFIFIYFAVPETKNKPLHKIAQDMKRNYGATNERIPSSENIVQC